MGWSDVPKDALAFRLSSMHSGPESSLAAMEVELTASKVSDEVETQGAPVMHGMGLGLGLELRLAENLAQGPWQWHLTILGPRAHPLRVPLHITVRHRHPSYYHISYTFVCLFSFVPILNSRGALLLYRHLVCVKQNGLVSTIMMVVLHQPHPLWTIN